MSSMTMLRLLQLGRLGGRLVLLTSTWWWCWWLHRCSTTGTVILLSCACCGLTGGICVQGFGALHHVMLLLCCLMICAAASLQSNEATFDIVVGISMCGPQHITICGIQIMIGQHKLSWWWYNHWLLSHCHVSDILRGQCRSIEARLNGCGLCRGNALTITR